jgi:hypothetical protein
MSAGLERDPATGMRVFEPDGAVLDAFMCDTRSVAKIIQGPIGSGKTLACIMSIWMKALEQVKQQDGWRRCRAHVFRDCYDDKTEILTECRGWQLFKDLMPDDKVAQLNGNQLEFVTPIAHIAKPYVGEMIGFEGEGVDFLVTPNHRLWASHICGRKRGWLPFEYLVAEDAYGQDIRVRRDAEWGGLPTKHSEKVFEWLGFWFAEGSGNVYTHGDGYSRRKLVITQVKSAGIEYARQLFCAAGIPFTENVRSDNGINFRVAVCPQNAWLFDELLKQGGALRKTVPAWMKSAPAGHLRSFLAGYIFGDGYISGGTTKAGTSSRQLADDMQDIALRAGMVANVALANKPISLAANALGITETAPHYDITFVTKKKYRPRLNNKYAPQKQYRRWYRERYAGTIYCVEVPTHVIYVRRNGRAFWCGQTYGKLKDTTLKSWLEWFPEAHYGKFYASPPLRHEIRCGDVALDVHFIALEDEWSADYFRSLETTICWFNELQFMDRLLFDEAVTRVGRYPRVIDGGAVHPQVIADMNAPAETHWVPIMRREVAMPDWFTAEQRRAHEKPPDWSFYVQPPGLLEVKQQDGESITYRENPKAENLRYLPGGSRYYLNAIQGKTKAWIDANVLNRVSPRRDGKPVLRDFSRAVHVAKQPLAALPGLELLIGCDFGRRPAAIIAQCVRGQWAIVHELIGRDMGADKFAPLLRNELAQRFPGMRFRIWGDPSGDFPGQNDDQVPFRIFRAHRLPVLPAPSFLFSVRLQAIEAALTRMHEGVPSVLISPTCTTLIAALDGGWHYRRMKVVGERYAEEPEKDEYSDPADAFGYLLLGGGEGRLLLGGTAEPKRPTQTRRDYNPFARKVGGIKGW